MNPKNKNNIVDHPMRYARRNSVEAERSENPKPNYVLRRLGAGAALLAVAAVGSSVVESSLDYMHSDEAHATAVTSATATVEFGTPGTATGHETAEQAIKIALKHGLTRVAAETSDANTEPLDVSHSVEDFATYNQADDALKMAHYDDILPDAHDTLTVEVEVTVDSEQHVSYEVTDAKIVDIVNNH